MELAYNQLQIASKKLAAALGAHHPSTLRCTALMAQCQLFSSPEQAEQLADHTHNHVVKVLGPSHRDTAVVAFVCCQVALYLRKNETWALQHITAAYDIALNSKQPALIAMIERCVVAVYSRARCPVSNNILFRLEESVRVAKQNYGEGSDHVIDPLLNLAEAYYTLGSFDKAHHCLTRALKIADAVNMIFLLGHLFKPAAQLSQTDVQERNRMVSDRLSPATAAMFANILFAIAAVFEAEGKLEDAQGTQLQALAALEIAGLSTTLSACEVLGALARILFRDGHYGDALAYMEKSYNILLEYHETSVPTIREVFWSIHVIGVQLRKSGYMLMRHVDSRHRFAIYI
jgi:tetratricopeptide (TPR) repeat protein